ncbi:MAG: phosphoribosylformimino-5-aminoimidazole carboxamide ribotide isomerase [Verrucomicrobiota bacterium]
MRFRPCIDIHDGRVKQLVGSTLNDERSEQVVSNYVSEKSPAYYASLYRRDGLEGGHVIMLGRGNESAAREALAAYPGGLQVGGGITPENAQEWLDAGAEKIIITSYVFQQGTIDKVRLKEISSLVGSDKLVLDLSSRKLGDNYYVATDRWQQVSAFKVDLETLIDLADYCSEFLIHAVDSEGKMAGIDEELLAILAECPLPVTYAGGIQNLKDLHKIDTLCSGKVDATAGSCLDIFGGRGLRYRDVVEFDRARRC